MPEQVTLIKTVGSAVRARDQTLETMLTLRLHAELSLRKPFHMANIRRLERHTKQVWPHLPFAQTPVLVPGAC